MPFTEFYCNNAIGSNINAGSTTGTAIATYTGGDFTSGTSIFFKSSADFSSLSTGGFVCLSTGNSTGLLIGRISAFDDTADTVTIHSTARAGSLSSTSGNVTLIYGGAWQGPTGGITFPFGIVTSGLVNESNNSVRVNFKNNQTYSITGGLSTINAGPIRWEGYSNTPGDRGRAVITGPTGIAIVLLTINSNYNELVSFDLNNNGTISSSDAVRVTSSSCYINNVIVHDIRGNGFFGNAGNLLLEECEAYNCNRAANANGAGFQFSSNTFLTHCISHHNISGVNTHGFYSSNGNIVFDSCISYKNAKNGLYNIALGPLFLTNCDFYENSGNGISSFPISSCLMFIKNSNFIKNSLYGISGASTLIGTIINCGFGSGSMANTSGALLNTRLIESNNIIYASDVTPWVDPNNGDFRINLAAAKNAGRGSFTQISGSGTIGYPDIGAAQHYDIAEVGGSATIIPPLIGNGVLLY